MDRRNLIIAGVAVLLGLVAVYLANSWFSGVEQQQERVAEEQQLQRIAVARNDLAFGDPLTADNVRLVNWPAQSVPAGSYSDVSRLLAGNNVAIRPIAAGEPILTSRISERAILSANLPPDMRAVSISVDPVSGVSGFVTPGDVVDVMLTRKIPGDGATNEDQMTSVVLENVQVLAIDQGASEKDTDPKLGKTATLQVDQMGAQKLALASSIGRLSLALRNVENQVVGSSTTVTTANLGGGGMYIAARSSPAARAAPAPAAVYSGPAPSAPARSSASAAAQPRRLYGPTMTVVRGTEAGEYEVKRYGGY
ncbi:Flp pilus assembly protein CpaB [Allopontixanthobacter sp.]|uniref:Flp pilus assembly protein CpaB n=1 Tax=Allopontixanthobacter sp. TaxID=2906452 RepID=UPI002ABCC602|nr:Flp pilus assembly protein CpaB [Allopontixanthobacter sp.]MDZ4307001.1 Flp pilus assembly protein CpaB [Allopontixanthobacter sp.]